MNNTIKQSTLEAEIIALKDKKKAYEAEKALLIEKKQKFIYKYGGGLSIPIVVIGLFVGLMPLIFTPILIAGFAVLYMLGGFGIMGCGVVLLRKSESIETEIYEIDIELDNIDTKLNTIDIAPPAFSPSLQMTNLHNSTSEKTSTTPASEQPISKSVFLPLASAPEPAPEDERKLPGSEI